MAARRKEANLCGKCMIMLRESYEITEFGRREKLTCDHCGKRRYGCRCELVKCKLPQAK